jgi:hypothetical protein
MGRVQPILRAAPGPLPSRITLDRLGHSDAPGKHLEQDPVGRLLRRSMFWKPARHAVSAWIEHVPFAFWLVDVLRPGVIVELGTHSGVSYSAMCQAVQSLGLATSCFAVDNWKGDEHSGFYDESVYWDFRAFHDRHYNAFSRLVRSTFDEALPHFEDGTIDLLHIDGLHTYDAVRHDFESWLPKLSANAIVLLHDTNVRESTFAVHRLWREISSARSRFEFTHGNGLGVLAIGKDYSDPLSFLLESEAGDKEKMVIRSIFSELGRSVRLDSELTQHAESSLSKAAHRVMNGSPRAFLAPLRAAARVVARFASAGGHSALR